MTVLVASLRSCDQTMKESNVDNATFTQLLAALLAEHERCLRALASVNPSTNSAAEGCATGRPGVLAIPSNTFSTSATPELGTEGAMLSIDSSKHYDEPVTCITGRLPNSSASSDADDTSERTRADYAYEWVRQALKDFKRRTKSWRMHRLHRLTQTSWFEFLAIILILMNTVVVGIEANWEMENWALDYTLLPVALWWLDWGLSLCFVIEMILRLCGEGPRFCFSHGWKWNMFDAICVCSDVAEKIAAAESENHPNLIVLRVIRVARIARALRILRVFKLFKGLRLMTKSILHSGQSLFWALTVLLMNMYLFAIFIMGNISFKLRQADTVRDTTVNESLTKLFGSLSSSLWTMFASVTGGQDWRDVSDVLGELDYWNALVFAFYVFFTVFAVMNIITGIFVDSAFHAVQMDKEEVVEEQLEGRNLAIKELRKLFKEADIDKTGTLSIEEFRNFLKHKKVRASLAALEMEVHEAHSLFNLLDIEGTGSIGIEDFIFGCMRLKGTARALDLASLMCTDKRMVGQLSGMNDTLNLIVASIVGKSFAVNSPESGEEPVNEMI